MPETVPMLDERDKRQLRGLGEGGRSYESEWCGVSTCAR